MAKRRWDDRAAFERMIGRAPHDPTPRLVYADWLEERGDPVAGEYHRMMATPIRRNVGGIPVEETPRAGHHVVLLPLEDAELSNPHSPRHRTNPATEFMRHAGLPVLDEPRFGWEGPRTDDDFGRLDAYEEWEMNRRRDHPYFDLQAFYPRDVPVMPELEDPGGPLWHYRGGRWHKLVTDRDQVGAASVGRLRRFVGTVSGSRGAVLFSPDVPVHPELHFHPGSVEPGQPHPEFARFAAERFAGEMPDLLRRSWGHPHIPLGGGQTVPHPGYVLFPNHAAADRALLDLYRRLREREGT